MNGTSVNDVLLSNSTPTPLKHLDKIQFGLGPGKFAFTFCLRSVDGSQCSIAIESRPSAKVSRTIFVRSSVLQQTLVKENNVKHGYPTFDAYYNLLVEREDERLKKFPHNGRSPQVLDFMQ